jgi:hypothetical protein
MIAMWLAQRASRPLRCEREFSKAKPAGRVLLLVDFFSSLPSSFHVIFVRQERVPCFLCGCALGMTRMLRLSRRLT